MLPLVGCCHLLPLAVYCSGSLHFSQFPIRDIKIMNKLVSRWAAHIKTKTWTWDDTYSVGSISHLSRLLNEIAPAKPSKLYGYSFLFNNQTNSELGADGYDNYQAPQSEDGALFSRRMWVGGMLEYFSEPPKLNDQVKCVEKVKSVRSVGTSTFVSIARDFFVEESRVMKETRTLVYTNERFGIEKTMANEKNLIHDEKTMANEKNLTSEKAILVTKTIGLLHQLTNGIEHTSTNLIHSGLGFGPSRRTLTFRPLDVLRYNALSYNLHKIHYDKRYCLEENLPDIVVSGPMLVLTMLHCFSGMYPEIKIKAFKYRNSEPCYVDDVVDLVICEDLVCIEKMGRPLCRGTIDPW